MVLERKEPSHFGAGPAQVPTKVLQKAAQDLINFQGIGLGIGEISHRSKEATEVIENSKRHLKQLLEIPDSYEVFFMQGGGTTGFSSIASNLTAASLARTGKVGTAAYLVTGAWSEKAAQEAERLGVPTECIFNTKRESGKFTTIPETAEWIGKLSSDKYSYVYLCENETVHGVEWPEVPKELAGLGIPVVADLSSDILSRKIDVERYSVIMAGLQKNIGLAGLTLYIVRKSLLEEISHVSDKELLEARVPVTPIAMHYPTVAKNNSAYNTIPLFTLHVMDLVSQHLIEQGGLVEQQKRNEEKAALLYGSLDKFPDFYALPVERTVRSKMNIVFTIKKEGLDDLFLKEAQALGLTGLKGHRSVGGFRASLYNVVELDSVQKLANFVIAFAQKHS